MSKLSLIVSISSAASICFGAAILRSPRDAANFPDKPIRRLKTTAVSSSVKITPLPPAVRPPRSFHITLMCEPRTNIFGYHWYRGSNSLPDFTPTNGTYTENNWVVQSNLWPGVYYDFAVAAVGTNNVESDLSPIVHWPQPKTNFVAFGVSGSTNGNWSARSTIVMDQRLANFRLKRVSTGYELHSSPAFMPWTTVTNWSDQNPLPTFYLRHSNWDNVTGKAMPD